ncbi:DUF805 domain-containing protein [Sulfurospirillum sp. 1612]|uniref:DUF805 domain-containing protein n=1 Tax=Sulfurospirillum sp. 1612 TaxID=3094835 RepID=UPI002F92789A
MKGKILDFNAQSREGVISGDDGQRYTFLMQEWQSAQIRPTIGQYVDFVAQNNIATSIYVEPKATNGIENVLTSENIFMRYYVGVLKNYVTFSGRARREEFWYFTLFSFLISLLLSAINPALSGLYSLAVLLPTLAVSARRLHDTDRSAWWLLLYLIPIIGLLVLILFFIFDSKPGANRFGANPKGID